MTETMLAERFEAPSLDKCEMPNSFLKAGRVRTPPMMPMSMPKRVPPKHDCQESCQQCSLSIKKAAGRSRKKREIFEKVLSYCAGEEKDPPVVHFWRVDLHGLVADD